MVDPENLVLVHQPVKNAVKPLRALQIITKRLFNYDSPESFFLIRQSGFRKIGTDSLIHVRRGSHVKYDITAYARLIPHFRKLMSQIYIIRYLIIIQPVIFQILNELRNMIHILVTVFSIFSYGSGHFIPEIPGGHLSPSHSKQHKPLRQQILIHKGKQGRNKFPGVQIACSAENNKDQVAGFFH